MLKLKAETGTVNAPLRRQHCPERQSAEVRAHRCRLRACTPGLTESTLHHAFIEEKPRTLQEPPDRFSKMLTDTIVEEEFELKEEEPWFDKQDLEHGTTPPQALSLEPNGRRSII